MSTRLSLHFTLEAATRSQTATRLCLDNTPSPEVLANMEAAAQEMENVRTILDNCAIQVTSWFRSEAVNTAVCGKPTPSAHQLGWAVDFVCPLFGTPLECARAIAASSLQFDQLIWEGTWVHISFAPALRRQVLTATFHPGGKVTYSKGV